MKLFKRYNDFIRNLNEGTIHQKSTNTYNPSMVNENVQAAKDYMRTRAERAKLEAEMERQPIQDPAQAQAQGGEKKKPKLQVKLSPEEARRAENNPEFLQIKAMCSRNPSWTLLFTKFYFEDLSELEPQRRIEDLTELMKQLEELRPILDRLPRPVETYVSKAAYAEEMEAVKSGARQEPRTALERLLDDIEILKGNRVTKKWIDNLLPFQKEFFTRVSPAQQARVDRIAQAFDDFGKTADGKVNPEKNAYLQDIFWEKVKQWKTLGALLGGAEDHIKATLNSNMIDFLEVIDNVNKKYGNLNGADTVLFEKNILILEVKSFVANRDLNANTAHCIAKSQSMWDQYVGDNKFTKQYYIYNFNLAPTDDRTVIGITIGEGGKVTACHDKRDGGFTDKIQSYMKSLGLPMSLLAPMTSEEIAIKKKRMEANKEIVKSNITLEKVQQLFEDGADVNASNGKPLENAVKEDDYERAKYLLDMGANPNLNKAINHTKNLRMIKLLVDYRSEINNSVWTNIMHDYDAVEYVLNAGVDPNVDKGGPLRTAAKAGDEKMIELLLRFNADLTLRGYMVLKNAAESGFVDTVKLIWRKLKQNSDKVTTDPAAKKEIIDDVMHWCSWSTKLEQSGKKEEIMQLLQNLN